MPKKDGTGPLPKMADFVMVVVVGKDMLQEKAGDQNLVARGEDVND